MTDESTATSGATETPEEVSAEGKPVPYSTYKKALSEKRNVMEKMRSLEERLSHYEQAKEQEQKVELEKQGEYKRLLEMKDQEMGKIREHNEVLAGELTRTWKRSAFFNKLGSNLKRSEYEKFIDYDAIVLNPDTNEVDGESVDLAVNSFKDLYSDLLEVKEVKTLPGNAPLQTAPKSVASMDANEKKAAMNAALTDIFSRKLN